MSEKNLDRQGRQRNKVVAFRASPEEAKLFDVVAKAAGMTKQDYIISKLLNREIVVKTDISIYYRLRELMKDIYLELQRLEKASDAPNELWECVDTLSREFVALRGNEAPSVEKADSKTEIAAEEKLGNTEIREDAPIREESRVLKANRTAHQIINRFMPQRRPNQSGGERRE